MSKKNSELNQLIRLNKGRKISWVCAVGKHIDVWDYLIIGSFENCFDCAWRVLQHEVDVPWHRFKSELKRSNGYIGKFAEIKKADKKPTFDSGMLIGKSIFMFDDPTQVEVGLSKPVYACLTPGTPDFIFAHQIYRGDEQTVYRNQLGNYYRFKGEVVNELALIERESLKYTSYPLIITDSPFILAKVYTEGLIGALVTNILSIASIERESTSSRSTAIKGTRKEIYEWIKPCPKEILVVQEKQKKFGQQEYYTELEDYSTAINQGFKKTNSSLKQIGSSISQIEVGKKITSRTLVKRVLQQLNSCHQ